jgi:hypothetical protein
MIRCRHHVFDPDFLLLSQPPRKNFSSAKPSTIARFFAPFPAEAKLLLSFDAVGGGRTAAGDKF